jgi:hypothetical protein
MRKRRGMGRESGIMKEELGIRSQNGELGVGCNTKISRIDIPLPCWNFRF